MIFDIWLDLPVWGVFCGLAALYGLSALCIHRLSFGAARAHTATLGGVVAPFFGSVAVLFSLLTGFLANEVWDRNRHAQRAILAERDGLLAVHAISLASVSDMRAIRVAAEAYARALVVSEWPRMAEQESSPEAGRAVLDLLGRVADPRIGAEAGPAVQAALFDTVLKLRSARDDRLAMSGDRTDRTKWIAVLLLCLITQAAIAIVHLEKPRAQLAALAIFSTAAVIALGLVAIRERPFDGPLRFPSSPIEEALQTMSAKAPPPG